MNIKKFVFAFIAVYVLLEVTNFLIHGVFLNSTYMSEGVRNIFRPQEEMMGMMWIMWVTDLVWAFFFVFFFVKGYENKGIAEGLRFGLYMGLFTALIWAYQSYAVYPIPYSLALEWFIYGMIQALLLGATAALVYKPKEVVAAQPATA
jgi:hypothetical protein